MVRKGYGQMQHNSERKKSYMVTVNGKTREYPAGITFGEIAGVYQKDYPHQIALAVRNGKIRELFKKIDRDCTVEFLTLADDTGHKTYNRTATIILMKAINEVVGADKIEKIKVEFAIGNGYYCSKKGDFEVTDELVENIKAKMQEYVDITPGSVSVMGLMNDKNLQVQLLVDEDVLHSEYFGCHPCVNTASLRVKTKDVFERFLNAVNHDYITVQVPIGI